MQVVNKKVSELIPYANNPRKNEDAVEYVAESIRQFGFKIPIVIDKDNVVVCGHTRLLACEELGIEEVPCVVADDLSKKQIKAFRLADNKVAEKSTWDYAALDIELKELTDIDLVSLGFEFDEEEEPEKENERLRTDNAYNLQEVDIERVEGFYQMPILEPEHYTPENLIGFNYALTAKEKNVGVHFYLDDYQFERVWTSPDKYIELLSNFDCVFTPDFSLYIDMPIAMQIWNTYRSRLIGQMMQDNGLTVIPTVSWAGKDSYDFCFDGLPECSTLTISTIGVKEDKEALKIWKDGVTELLERKHPKRLLVYGGAIPFNYGETEVTYFSNSVTERMKNGR